MVNPIHTQFSPWKDWLPIRANGWALDSFRPGPQYALSGWAADQTGFELAISDRFGTIPSAGEVRETPQGTLFRIAPTIVWLVGDGKVDHPSVSCVETGDAWCWFRLEGDVEHLLSRAVRVDPVALLAGHCALTRFWSIQTMIWRVDQNRVNLALPAPYCESALSLILKT